MLSTFRRGTTERASEAVVVIASMSMEMLRSSKLQKTSDSEVLMVPSPAMAEVWQMARAARTKMRSFMVVGCVNGESRYVRVKVLRSWGAGSVDGCLDEYGCSHRKASPVDYLCISPVRGATSLAVQAASCCDGDWQKLHHFITCHSSLARRRLEVSKMSNHC